MLLDATDTGPYRNYAVPDDGAEPTPADINALIAAFAERERKPRLEYLATVCPRVEPALLDAGFGVEARLPVLTCAPDDVVAATVDSPIELVLASTDDELRLVAEAQNEAYGAPDATEHDAARLRRTLDRDGLVALAVDTATGIGVGAGLCTPPHRGVSELAAVGVRTAYRRRGIAAALTSLLTRACPTVGINTPFLMAAGSAEERIYQRIGYRRVAESLHISR
ncbi:GNAT family N-acetyltransferase [Saccharopolyspora sp. NPDC050389]|uniref:GNAT family N-acetyltransferase n=1 Tax=Saccharopolyspora sp. NPDC050389 TaxID=3155516 RepID=UPI0034021924